jgi:hypothetical protein
MTIPKALTFLASALLLAPCGRAQKRAWDGSEVGFAIESNPANLDAGYGQDPQSQRIAALIYSGLAERESAWGLSRFMGDLGPTDVRVQAKERGEVS